MTTYGYIRISSLKQEEGHGKDVQRTAIEAFAKAQKLGSVELYEETYSGEHVNDREEYQALRAVLRAGDCMIIYKLDRLSRSMIDTEVMLGEMVDRGVRVHSCQPVEEGWLDPERFKDPQNKLMRQVMAAFNEYDKALLLNRMGSGLKAKAAKGGFAGGTPPFGYRIENDDLVIDEAKRPAVLAILALIDQGKSDKAIADHMARGFGDVRAHGKDTPMVWIPSAIERIRKRAGLYLKGEYKDRASSEVKLRPDLVMLKEYA